jgi:hypothetical protein
MIIERHLPESLWAEAVSHATYLRNRAPTRVLAGATPDLKRGPERNLTLNTSLNLAYQYIYFAKGLTVPN